jgi:hypothetical protein
MHLLGDDPIDDHAERRPPPGAGHEAAACCQRSLSPWPASPATSTHTAIR